MAAKALDAAAVGLPSFDVPPVDEAAAPADPFALSSHQRARRALEFGLHIDEPGFNIFVLGESRSGRMTATLDYLKKWIADKPAPPDWIYVANFQKPHRPRPYRLPAGQGRILREAGLRVGYVPQKLTVDRTMPITWPRTVSEEQVLADIAEAGGPRSRDKRLRVIQ